MATAQEILSKLLDASVAVLAAQCAKGVAADKYDDAREALIEAQHSRAVSW